MENEKLFSLGLLELKFQVQRIQVMNKHSSVRTVSNKVIPLISWVHGSMNYNKNFTYTIVIYQLILWMAAG